MCAQWPNRPVRRNGSSSRQCKLKSFTTCHYVIVLSPYTVERLWFKHGQQRRTQVARAAISSADWFGAISDYKNSAVRRYRVSTTSTDGQPPPDPLWNNAIGWPKEKRRKRKPNTVVPRVDVSPTSFPTQSDRSQNARNVRIPKTKRLKFQTQGHIHHTIWQFTLPLLYQLQSRRHYAVRLYLIVDF